MVTQGRLISIQCRHNIMGPPQHDASGRLEPLVSVVDGQEPVDLLAHGMSQNHDLGALFHHLCEVCRSGCLKSLAHFHHLLAGWTGLLERLAEALQALTVFVPLHAMLCVKYERFGDAVDSSLATHCLRWTVCVVAFVGCA